jgi:hypothetical protein
MPFLRRVGRRSAPLSSAVSSSEAAATEKEREAAFNQIGTKFERLQPPKAAVLHVAKKASACTSMACAKSVAPRSAEWL